MTDKYFRVKNGINVGASGSAASPVIHANSDFNTGIYFPAEDQFAISIGGTLGFSLDSSRNAVFASNLAVNGSAITTAQTTFNFVNSGVTTLNVGGAATSVVIGASASGTTTIRNANTSVLDLTASGDIAANGGDITSTATTFNLVPTAASIVNAFSAATTINQGSTTSAATLNFGNATPGVASSSTVRAGNFVGNGSGVTNVAAASVFVGTDTSTDANFYPVFADATGGDADIKSAGNNLVYNPNKRLFSISGRAEFNGTISTFGSSTEAAAFNANSMTFVTRPTTNNSGIVQCLAVTGKTGGSASHAFVTGLFSQAYHQGSGNVEVLVGMRSVLILQDPVPTTVASGISAYISSPVYIGAGTVTNVYGLRIDPQYNANSAPAAWGIFQTGANDRNYFSGRCLFNQLSDNGTDMIQVTGSGRFSGNVVSAGDMQAVHFNSTSDARLKTNVIPAKGLEVINKLKGVEFDFIQSGDRASGVIAQEIETVLPHVVKEGDDGFKRVAYDQIIAHLIEAVNELTKKVELLEASLSK